MSLRDLIESDATAVFSNIDDFAQAYVYYPEGGGAVDIVAVPTSHPAKYQEQAHHEEHIELLTLFIALSEIAGVATPERGAAIRPASAPLDERWDFLELADQDVGGLTVVWGKFTLQQSGHVRNGM